MGECIVIRGLGGVFYYDDGIITTFILQVENCAVQLSCRFIIVARKILFDWLLSTHKSCIFEITLPLGT